MPESNDHGRALVLSGGSIKGAFQAGAICELLERGFEPTHIYGTSVGALNGAFLVSEAGKLVQAGEPVDWPMLGRKLRDYWTDNITDEDVIFRKRSTIASLWSIIRNDFKGLLDMKPLYNIVYEVINTEAMRQSPVRLKVGAVNLVDGHQEIASQFTDLVEDWIIASTAIPVVMPWKQIGSSVLTDGGVRNVAMITDAINDIRALGSDDRPPQMVAILCQPEELKAVSLNPGNLMEFMQRLMDIIVNETVNNDLERLVLINDVLNQCGPGINEGRFRKYRKINLLTIRPENELIIDLQDFNEHDIARIVQQGEIIAKRQLDADTWVVPSETRTGELGTE